MTIADKVASLEDVEERLHWLYEEREGEFYRREVPGMVSKAALDEFRNSNIELKQKAEELAQQVEGGEIDREKYKELLAAEEKRAQESAERKGEWDKLRAQQQEKHEAEKAGIKGQITELENEVRTLMVDNNAISLLQEEDTRGSWPLLQGQIRDRTQVIVDGNGRRSVKVFTDEGAPALASDGTDQTLKGLVLELKAHPEFGKAFEGTGASGGGAPADTGGAGGKTLTAATKAELSDPLDRVNFIEKHGQDAYLDLPDQ